MRTCLGLLMVCLLTAVGPAVAADSAALVGTWTGTDSGVPFQLILRADGTGMLGDSPLRWKMQGGKLVVVEEGETNVYDAVLKGTTLTVSGGDLDEPMKLTRGTASKVPAPPAQAGMPNPAPGGKASSAPAQQFLAGQYSAYSGHSTYSGSYSSEKRGALCSNGMFYLNSETSSSGSSGMAGVQGGNSGRWTAEGNEMRGTLLLTFSNGQQQRIPYETSLNPKDRSYYGPAVIFDGTNYQRTGDGNCR